MPQPRRVNAPEVLEGRTDDFPNRDEQRQMRRHLLTPTQKELLLARLEDELRKKHKPGTFIKITFDNGTFDFQVAYTDPWYSIL